MRRYRPTVASRQGSKGSAACSVWRCASPASPEPSRDLATGRRHTRSPWCLRSCRRSRARRCHPPDSVGSPLSILCILDASGKESPGRRAGEVDGLVHSATSWPRRPAYPSRVAVLIANTALELQAIGSAGVSIARSSPAPTYPAAREFLELSSETVDGTSRVPPPAAAT
jgi:hypothetical protein